MYSRITLEVESWNENVSENPPFTDFKSLEQWTEHHDQRQLKPWYAIYPSYISNRVQPPWASY